MTFIFIFKTVYYLSLNSVTTSLVSFYLIISLQYINKTNICYQHRMVITWSSSSVEIFILEIISSKLFLRKNASHFFCVFKKFCLLEYDKKEKTIRINT